MKIPHKLVLIQLIFIISLLVFAVARSRYNTIQTRLFHEATREHNEKLIEQVFSFFRERYQQPLDDNSEWDESVQYIKKPYRSFEKENINTLLETFSINAIFHFNANGDLIYSVNDSSDQDLSSLFEGVNVKKILTLAQPKTHSFIKRDDRIYEVFGATIVPTHDIKHESDPKGFLFFIKLWDGEFLRELSSITQSQLTLKMNQEASGQPVTDATHSIQTLTDWNGKKVAQLVFTWNDSHLDRWKANSHATIWFLIITGLTIVLLIGFVFREWISKPLQATIENLRHSEDRFSQVAESAGEWIWEVDVSGKYTYSNAISEKILGYSPEELVNNKYWYSFFPSDLQEPLRNEVMDSIGRGKVFRDQVNPHVHKNGHIIILQASYSPFFDPSGRFLGFRGTGTDMTRHMKVLEDLKKALDKAEENDRLKSAFLNNISHEIRTPMNAIMGFSYLMHDSRNNPDKLQTYTDLISSAGQQLLSIIDDIINISAVETGQESIKNKLFNLNDLLRQVRDQFLPKTEAKGLQFELFTGLRDRQSLIITDETKLIQVISNLLSNAIKFTRKGSIQFGYSVKMNRLEFSVKDTGIGVPAGKYDLIFERFRQADESVIREYGGTGLGLSISKAYVELLGGKIWLDSDVNEGSVFYFDIPFNPGNEESFSPGVSKDGLGGSAPDKKIILVAEDQELNFLLIREMFAAYNWEIVRAHNGEEAVSKCHINPWIELVLMDLKMPVMDGYQATKQIKSFRPTLPVIVQTAYTGERDREKAFRAGCDEFISKPIDREHLEFLILKYVKP